MKLGAPLETLAADFCKLVTWLTAPPGDDLATRRRPGAPGAAVSARASSTNPAVRDTSSTVTDGDSSARPSRGSLTGRMSRAEERMALTPGQLLDLQNAMSGTHSVVANPAMPAAVRYAEPHTYIGTAAREIIKEVPFEVIKEVPVEVIKYVDREVRACTGRHHVPLFHRRSAPLRPRR